MGACLLILGHLAWVILMEFVNNNVQGAQHFTSLGVRAGWVGVAQLPLLILLAGKNNLIGFMTGISYERLNVLHRWTARMFFFLVTLHLLFLHLAWNAFPGLMSIEYSTDACIPTGWAAYGVLLWLILSSAAPIRSLSYEFFVIQHIITWMGFAVAVVVHLDTTALYSRVYIFIPIGLYIVDRLIRTALYGYHNVRPAKATLIPMEGGVTKIHVKAKNLKNWTPGSHVLLRIPKFGIIQSHPATIASVPTSHDADLVFLLKAHRGFTGRLFQNATVCQARDQATEERGDPAQQNFLALIDGPYGGCNYNFSCFDSTILIAGSTGVTFTLPILLDIASRAKATKLPMRCLKFVWVVKNTAWTSWISEELQSAFAQLQAAGIQTSFDVYVTCDDAFAGEDEYDEGLKAPGCSCGQEPGSCCCVNVEKELNDDAVKQSKQTTSRTETVDKEKDVVEVLSKETSSTSSTLGSGASLSGVKSRVLPCALFYSGRPKFREMFSEQLEGALGETGVAVCGPLGLSSEVRRTVVWCSDQRAIHKGTGAQGIYLHAESFGW